MRDIDYECCIEIPSGLDVNDRVGIFTDISFEDYCALDAVNNSSLNDFERSPAHYFVNHVKKNSEKNEPTPSMQFGTAIHTAVLERLRFEKTYTVEPAPSDFPGCLVNVNDYKAKCSELGLKISGTKDEMKARILEVDPKVKFFDDIEAKLSSRFKLLKVEQWDACMAISDRIRNSPTASTLFSNGISEVTMLWIDPETGLRCKARLDYFGEFDGKKIIVDLKSTEDARPQEFSRSIANYGYHRQAAHYLNGLKTLHYPSGMFIFAAYERTPPYAASFTYASEAMLSSARAELSNLMGRLKKCKTENNWPAYDENLNPIDLPAWRKNNGSLAKEMEAF